MIGPEDKDDQAGAFKDFTDYTNCKDGSYPFPYNPGVMDISKQDGSFPETDDAEYPEKM